MLQLPHIQFALRETEQGTVLLKNEQNILSPDSRTIKSITVIGRDASDAPKALGVVITSIIHSYIILPLQGITKRAWSAIGVTYTGGSGQSQTIQSAHAEDVAIVFANGNEAEGSDRSSLSLLDNQGQLIEKDAQANPHTIVVLNTCAPILMPWADQV